MFKPQRLRRSEDERSISFDSVVKYVTVINKKRKEKKRKEEKQNRLLLKYTSTITRGKKKILIRFVIR